MHSQISVGGSKYPEDMGARHATVGPVVGLKNIGELFGRCGRTVRRWIDSEDFPASRLPDGAWATTHTLIDEWLFARSGVQLDDGDEPQATTYL